MTGFVSPENAIIRKWYILISMLLYKAGLEIGLWYVVSEWYPVEFGRDFNPIAYANGLVWCLVLFFFIKHEKKDSSSIFLYFTLLFQIVPLTVIFALCGRDIVYYNIICLGFFLCELLVGFVKQMPVLRRSKVFSNVFLIGCNIAIIFIVFHVFRNNGLPSLLALDIYKVYQIRGSNEPVIGKYVMYLIGMCYIIVIPFLISRAIIRKQWWYVGILAAIVFLLYLYTGNKVYLFSIPVVLVTALWCTRGNMYEELTICFCIGVFVLSCLTVWQFYQEGNGFFTRVFSLFGRRTLLEPAAIKFNYYDFFLDNPRLGISGLMPRWLLNVPSPYPENLKIGEEISRLYMDYESNATTGMLGEAVAHFGLLGIFVSWLIFASVLRLLDVLQYRTSYRLVVGGFCFFVYWLNDGPLLASLITGPIMIIILLAFFYDERQVDMEGK